MRRFLFLAVPSVVCLTLLAGFTRGEPATDLQASPTAAGQRQVAVNSLMGCPIFINFQYVDYWNYEVALCNPNYVGFSNMDGPPGLLLGGCSESPDCMPVVDPWGRRLPFSKELARNGTPMLPGEDVLPRLGDNVRLLDTQLVDLVLDSATPAAPRRIKLFVFKEGTGSDSSVFVGGREVVRSSTGAVPLVTPRQTEVLAEHACIIRLGNLEYPVLLYRETPALKATVARQ